MKKLLLILAIILLSSCLGPGDRNVLYNYEVHVTYTDGTKEVISGEYLYFSGAKIEIPTDSETGCLVIYPRLLLGKTLACGVRKYEVTRFDSTITKIK